MSGTDLRHSSVRPSSVLQVAALGLPRRQRTPKAHWRAEEDSEGSRYTSEASRRPLRGCQGGWTRGGVPSFPRWPHPVFRSLEKLGSRSRHPHLSPRSTTLAIAVGHLSQSLGPGCRSPHPKIWPTFLHSIELDHREPWVMASDAGHRPPVGPTSVDWRHVRVSVSPCCPRRGKWF